MTSESTQNLAKMMRKIKKRYPDVPEVVVESVLQYYMSDPEGFKRDIAAMPEEGFVAVPTREPSSLGENGGKELTSMRIIKKGTPEYEEILRSKFQDGSGAPTDAGDQQHGPVGGQPLGLHGNAPAGDDQVPA